MPSCFFWVLGGSQGVIPKNPPRPFTPLPRRHWIWITPQAKPLSPSLIVSKSIPPPVLLRLLMGISLEVPGSEELHDRFILTERRGVQFSVGLDDGSEGEVTNIHILSEELRGSTWDKYLSKNPAYDLVDEVTVQGSAK